MYHRFNVLLIIPHTESGCSSNHIVVNGARNITIQAFGSLHCSQTCVIGYYTEFVLAKSQRKWVTILVVKDIDDAGNGVRTFNVLQLFIGDFLRARSIIRLTSIDLFKHEKSHEKRCSPSSVVRRTSETKSQMTDFEGEIR